MTSSIQPSERQRRIRDALNDRRPELAQAWGFVLETLSVPAVLGAERMRLALICHAMRELMNRIPAAWGSAPPRHAGPSASELEVALASSIADHPDFDLNAASDLVPVPSPVLRALRDLVEASQRRSRTIRSDIAAFLTDEGNSESPAVRRWFEVHAFFMAGVHLGDAETGASHIPTDEQILEQIETFEKIVDNRLSAFFRARHELDGLLANLNATDDGVFTTPSPEEVDMTLLSISRSQLRRVFFEGLDNPSWLRPLSSAGAFLHPPEPRASDDGFNRDVYWPEISYLTRMARIDPVAVVDALVPLSRTRNAWVRRGVVEIGSQVPPADGARLSRILRGWEIDGFGWRMDARELTSFAVTLLEGGERKDGMWLVSQLFEPRAADGDGRYTAPRVGIEDYWYESELTRVVVALGPAAFPTLVRWLETFVKLSGRATDAWDMSGMDRPTMRSHESALDNPEQSLIDAVRDVSLEQMRVDPGRTIRRLTRNGFELLRKVALFVLAEHLRLSREQGRSADIGIELAIEQLADDANHREHLRIEYAELARAAGDAGERARAAIDTFLTSARASNLQGLEQRRSDASDAGVSDEDDIASIADRYEHPWLAAIDSDALSDAARNKLSALDQLHGPREDALEPAGIMRSWTGPNPHTTRDEMSRLSPLQLMTLITGWHLTGDGFGPEPTHEGQGRELAALLTEHPTALLGETALVKRLRPTYVRAVLSGWNGALRAGIHPDFGQAVIVLRDVLSHPNESNFVAEGREYDDDTNYQSAKREAVAFLGEVLDESRATGLSAGDFSAFAELLVSGTRDDAAWSIYDEHQHTSDSSDPLNLSLNWQWPKRVHALLALATREDKLSWRDRALAEVETELTRRDRHGAVRAVIGQALNRLYVHARPWLDKNVDLLFGGIEPPNRGQQVALTTAIATHQFHPATYVYLRQAIAAAIRLQDDLVAGWRNRRAPQVQIGEWVINSIVRGSDTLDGEIPKLFFATTSAPIRGEAMKSLAWSFFRARTVDPAIRDRFAQLWDDRIAYAETHGGGRGELIGFWWLARAEWFAAEWWLPRFKRVLVLEPDVAAELVMVGQDLAAASSKLPREAFDVLQLLLRPAEAGMMQRHLSRNALPMVLANALRSGDRVLEREANIYLNELGARGYLQLEDQVETILRGDLPIGPIEN
jgi:hypothetical protein